LLCGTLAAVVVARVMSNVLAGVSTEDPFTYVIVCGLTAAVALTACYIPVLRATHVDPFEALRFE